MNEGLLRLVALISGRGSNLQSIIDVAKDDYPARVVAVISNRPEAQGLVRARAAGIAAYPLDHQRFASRAAFESELMRLIDRHDPGLVLLAGFMRVLGTRFVEHYAGRLMNIHPSLLPRYPGLDTHARVLAAGDAKHGATVHFVTPDLDGGPIIVQGEVSVRSNEDATSLAGRVLREEHRIYPQAIRWFAERRLSLRDGRVLLDGKPTV
jgi:phosphoribosylglycinamide formyltransferase-1